jgi:hypothetical protein
MIYKNKSIDLYKKFTKTGNISDWLSYFSCDVWEDMQFMFQQPTIIGKIGEVEITNRLVRKLAQLLIREKSKFPIRLFHSIKEHVKGSDLEVIIPVGKGQFVKFYCQAKRLYFKGNGKQEGTYEQLWHNVGLFKKSQLDLLISHCKKQGSLPLYLFYNYYHGRLSHSQTPTKEEFGCTLLNAYYLKNSHTKGDKLGFKNFHPIAKPLSELSSLNIQENNDVFGKVGDEIELNTLSLKDLNKDPSWREIAPALSTPKRFTGVIDLESILREERELEEGFNPKFRIVFTEEPIEFREKNFAI